ncbi:B12-binding domain-containing protein [Streptomyces sp. KL116D]|uniref:cobalamin B12-binding domain-containing protein n=1 Tax=Streptomyces sp. KL116D TaxID=3045152 RepID=UPI003556D11D
MACVDGEWHALPARLVAEVLRLRGWHVDYLGAQVPTDHPWSRTCTDAAPTPSCCPRPSPTHLPVAHNAISACQAAGIPVLAGGAGFGPDGSYARMMQADWAPDAVGADTALTHGLTRPFRGLGPAGRRGPAPPERPGIHHGPPEPPPARQADLRGRGRELPADARLHRVPARSRGRGTSTTSSTISPPLSTSTTPRSSPASSPGPPASLTARGVPAHSLPARPRLTQPPAEATSLRTKTALAQAHEALVVVPGQRS